MSKNPAKKVSRNPPIHIPLDFEDAIDGFLAVNPDEPVESKRKPPVKKPDGKKRKAAAKKK